MTPEEKQIITQAVIQSEKDRKQADKQRGRWANIKKIIREESSPLAKGLRRLAPGIAATIAGAPQIGIPWMMGSAVDEGVKSYTPYESVGDGVAQTVGLKPGDRGYRLVSAVGEFINPGYYVSPTGVFKTTDTIVNTGNKIIDNTSSKINDKIVDRAFKTGKLSYGEPQTFTMFHHSDEPITKFKFPFNERWDVRIHGADPNGVFGNVDKPIESGFMAERPFVSQWNVRSQKPLIQTGEIKGFGKNNIRNKIVARGRDEGADAVVFKDIKDNTLEGQNIIFATNNSKIQYKGGVGKVKYAGPTTGKTTYIKANPEGFVVDMDRMEYDKSISDLRKKVAEKLGLDYRDPRVSDSPEYQEGFENIINTWTQDIRNAGKTLVGSSKALLRSNIPLDGIPYIPDFETFVARNQARGFKETPEQLRKWYDSILEANPNIRIDNRYFSEIPKYESPSVKRVSMIPTENINSEKILLNPEEWIGIDETTLTGNNFGFNNQHPKFKYLWESKEPIKQEAIKQGSNFDKFLKSSIDEQNNIVKYWYGEKYSTIAQLRRNKKDYNAFIKWINKK